MDGKWGRLLVPNSVALIGDILLFKGQRYNHNNLGLGIYLDKLGNSCDKLGIIGVPCRVHIKS